jgi:hypothetical protein
MPRRSRNWDALNEQSNGEGVEYVGVVEDDAPAAKVREPRPRIRRRPPRPQPAQKAADTVLHMRPGSYISMNSDAARALHNAPVTEIGGQRVRRMQPGTYFVMADGQEAPVEAAMAGGMGAGGAMEWVSTIGSTVGDLFETGWGAYQQQQQMDAQAAAAREEARLRREAAEAERLAAETAAERAHAQRMAEIAAETEALARQAEARAAAAREAAAVQPAAAGPAGMPGWAIALLAVGGMGAVGLVVYLLTRKKD